ncbi:hypothetical protein [Methanosarcina vacuolata]|uniref:Uncharacterized protein n=1 Tax=Methanosarcina vacuolata Z-761 TaxID=1434123 RepID=A0A0E3Q2J8_9EURY|nr:hypothetical protein [Methanosarcina vacuolata]AKB43520.1 hypothetical protein MSVAZ_1251 [Methanosarcina vacuolata Z-761]
MTVSQKIENSKILLMPESGSDKQPIMLTVSSDLMKNYEAGSPVSIENSFCVAQDSKGEPIIVSVGSDKRLYAITRDSGSKTGWEQNDITPKVEDEKPGNVVAFEMVQMGSGPIVLACSVSSSSNASKTTMYVSSQLLKSDTTIQWDNFAQYWHVRPFQVSGSRMTKIYMGEDSSSTTSSVLAVVAIEKDNQAEYYRLNTNLEESEIWEHLTIPENAIKIHSLALGKQRGYPGVYSLYDTIYGQSLQFTSFPIKRFNGKTFSIFFQQPFGSKINSFAVLPSGSSNDNVYAAGEGVYLFRKGATKPITIAEKDITPTVQTLLARQDDKSVTLWMVNSDGMLGMTVSPFSSQTTWQPVLQICKDVSQTAALRNRYYKANQLFMVSNTNHLIYLWQDPENTQWYETNIPLYDTENTLSFDCYTTHMSFRDQASGVPVTDIELNLKSSAWTYLKVNGKAHTLLGNAKNQITLKPDLAGNITIINRVSTISTPVFELSAEWLKSVVDIDPATKVRNTLSRIQSGDELRAVVLADGNKLVSDSVSKESVDSAASAIKKLTDIANTLPQDSASRSVSGGTGDPSKPTTFAALLRDPTGSSRNLLSASNTKGDYFWGMRFDDDNVTYYEGRDARKTIVNSSFKLGSVSPELLGSSPAQALALDIGDIGNAIKSVAGDVLKALESGIEKVGGFIVQVAEGVFEFVVEVGGKLLKFAIETVEIAMNIISWVFQKIKVFFEDLVKWLGFMFDWEDIILTKKIIVNVTNQTLELAKYKIGDAETIVNNFFDEIEKEIDKIGPIPSEVSSLNLLSEGKKFCDSYSGAQDFLDSAPGNFANYHIMQSMEASSNSDFSVSSNTDPLTVFFTQVVYPLGEDIANIVCTFTRDIYDLFTTNNLTIGECFTKLSKDMLKQVIGLARTTISGLLKVLESAFSLIKEIVNSTLHIPVLSAFYKFISGGDDFSLLDVVSLMLSIPVTMLYKVLTGRSPYQRGSGNLEKMGYQELFDALSDDSTQLTTTTIATRSKAVDITLSGDEVTEVTDLPVSTRLKAVNIALDEEKIINMTESPVERKSQAIDIALTEINDRTGVKIYKYVGYAAYFFADAYALFLRSIKYSMEKLPKPLEYINFLLSLVKIAVTFPFKLKRSLEDDLYNLSWGTSIAIFLGSFIKVTTPGDNEGVKKGVEVWNLICLPISGILGLMILINKLIDQVTEGPNAGEILLDVATFAETFVRSHGGMLNAVATLDPDKESGAIFAVVSIIEGLLATTIRGGRTVAICISE